MTGLTRDFRGSRTESSAGDSSSTSSDVAVRRQPIVLENIIRLNRFLVLLTLRMGLLRAHRPSTKEPAKPTHCEKHRHRCQKTTDSVT